uniref:Lysosomal dipeptide transporter MFSD1 n=1 Tax=Arcella intermedia TaxID=1963864 RepID=A0A6B2L3Y0_9EUKA
MILLCLSLIPYGLYWSYDIPGAIQDNLTRWFGGPTKYTEADHLMMYSVYSYPNLLTPLFVGYFIDKVGVRYGAIITAGLILSGQVLYSLGVQFLQYWLCIIGRILIGLGGEGLFVTQGKFATRWFPGDKLSFLFGIVIAGSRLGTALNFVAMPALARVSVPLAVWMGSVVCGVSFVCSGVAYWVDLRGEKLEIVGPYEYHQTSLKKILLSMKDLIHLPKIAWLVIFETASFYACFITFLAVGSYIFQHTGQFHSEASASLFISIPNFLSIILPPLFGKLIDLKGFTSLWVSLSNLLQSLSMGLLLCYALGMDTALCSPWVVVSISGIAYSMFVSATWPMIAFIVEEDKVGRAFGAAVILENLGYIIIPAIIGHFQTNLPEPSKYYVTVDILLGVSTFSFLLSIIALITDQANGGKLNSDGKTKHLLKESLKTKISQTDTEKLIDFKK